jgi:hypothetical protein
VLFSFELLIGAAEPTTDAEVRSSFAGLSAALSIATFGRAPGTLRETSLAVVLPGLDGAGGNALCMTRGRIAVLMERPADSHVAYHRSV